MPKQLGPGRADDVYDEEMDSQKTWMTRAWYVRRLNGELVKGKHSLCAVTCVMTKYLGPVRSEDFEEEG